MPEVARLTTDEVLNIRRQMGQTRLAARDAFGQIEPIDRGRLEMAVNRQFTSSGRDFKYDNVPNLAATLLFGITMDHAFENGNKRTALVATLVLLDKNRQLLIEATEDELYELVRQLAAHELPLQGGIASADAEVAYLSRWLKSRMRSRVLGDHPLEYVELKKLLEVLGCKFDTPNGNFVKISRDRWACKIGYPRQNFQLDVPQIKRIRHSLRLDEAHGTDSAGFYDLRGQVDHFVNQHRNLLRRLADL